MKPTVLVVDDDEALVALLRRSLTSAGYDVVTASDGAEAYALVKAPGCACVLLDISMPGLNGAELLMLMQAEGLQVPAIIMTGSADFTLREMKEFACVVQLFHKPFHLRDLLTAVGKHAKAGPRPGPG